MDTQPGDASVISAISGEEESSAHLPKTLETARVEDVFKTYGEDLWDPDIVLKQKEWVDLMKLATDLGLPTDPENVVLNQDACVEMPPRHKYLLAGTWVDDSIHGRSIYFPGTLTHLSILQPTHTHTPTITIRTSHFLKICSMLTHLIPLQSSKPKENVAQNNTYRLFRSRELRFAFNLACFLQVAAPFFETPYNSSYSDWSVTNWDAPHGYLSRNTLSLVDSLCVVVYLLDSYLIFRTNPGGLSWANLDTKMMLRGLPSGAFRLCASLTILIDCILTFQGVNTGRFSRVLVPAIFISRRSNYRSIMKGVVMGMKRTGSILKFLFFVILIWGFIGECLFSNVSETKGAEEDIDDGDNFAMARFNTFLGALSTALLCFTSRVSALFIMQPFYEINKFSALYFVTLSVIADLFLMNIMTAIGSSEFATFSTQLLMMRLRRRYEAALSVFVLFMSNDNNGDGAYLRLDDWCNLIKRVQGKYRISQKTARTLFMMENVKERTPPDLVNFKSFLRMMACLACRVRVNRVIKREILGDDGLIAGTSFITSFLSKSNSSIDPPAVENPMNRKTRALSDDSAASNELVVRDGDAGVKKLAKTQVLKVE